MGAKMLPFLIGVVVGVSGALLVTLGGVGDEADDTGRLEVSKLRQQNEELAARIENRDRELAEATEKLVAAEARSMALQDAPPGEPQEDAPVLIDVEAAAEEALRPLTSEEFEAKLREYFQSIGAVIRGGGKEAKQKVREVFARASEEQIAALLEELETSADLRAKVGIAHALAQSGRPEIVEALAEIALDPESGFVEHRYIAHGMAFSDDDSVVPTLEEIAANDDDRGARANAAFGLARRGKEEGVELYAKATDEAFAENDPTALQYLGGFTLLGKAGLPAVRERLDTYKERQARLVLIEVLRSNKDREAVPALRALVNDLEVDKSVRDSAEKAIREIEAE